VVIREILRDNVRASSVRNQSASARFLIGLNNIAALYIACKVVSSSSLLFLPFIGVLQLDFTTTAASFAGRFHQNL